MYKIKKVILWPYDKHKSRREIEFELEKINVIHGDSRTGKTALIACIDFALGCKDYKIPVGEIMDYTEWFGVLLKSKEEEILISRKNPEKKSKGLDIYYLCEKNIDIPNEIKNGNTNLENVKNILNEKMNYYTKKIDVDEESNWNTKPSFRNSIAFNFQPQTIIASPDTLFYKTNLTQHREKLKREFQYLLGVIDNEMLFDKIRKKELEVEKKQIEKAIANEENIKKEIFNEIPILYSTAIDLNLINTNLSFEDKDLLLKELEHVIRENDNDILYDYKALENLNTNILQLEDKRSNVHLEILRYKKFKKICESNLKYMASNKFSENYNDRIELIRWLTDKLIEDEALISKLIDENVDFADVITSVEKYENLIIKNKIEYSNLENELRTIDIELKKAIDIYNNLSKEINMYYQKENEVKKLKNLERKKYEFIGELKTKVAQYHDMAKNNEYEERLKKITIELTKINGRIDNKIIDQKFKALSQKLSDDILKIIKTLDADDKVSPVNLEINDLTISVNSKKVGNSKDYLYQIGSASNWLSYHISVLLGLHRHFASLNPRRVLGFVVFDQPSQVYFPDNNRSWENGKTNDIKNVKKIFETLNIFNESNKDVQIIVLEHAGKSIWGDFENIVEVEHWNSEKKLIPFEWYEEDK